MSFDRFSTLNTPTIMRNLLLISSLSFCSESLSETTNHFSEDRHAQLMESAEQLRREGLFSDAEIVFKQLFDSVRANSGLFHEQQFVVLDRLIQIHLATADWQSLKQRLDYHEWLLNRLYSDNPRQLAEYLLINARHHEQAARETTGPARNWHLVQTRQQLWRAVTALEAVPEESQQLPGLLHQIAMHHYDLSRQSDLRWLTSFETRSDEPAMISGWAMQGNDVAKRSYDIGAELVMRIIDHFERNPANDAGAQAAVMAQLLAYRGDWELLFGREHNAYSFYDKSLSLTEHSSCKDELQKQLFGKPVQLPVYTFITDINNCSGHFDDLDEATFSAEITDNTLVLTGIYRPRWHQNQWLVVSASSTLNALTSGEQHD